MGDTEFALGKILKERGELQKEILEEVTFKSDLEEKLKGDSDLKEKEERLLVTTLPGQIDGKFPREFDNPRDNPRAFFKHILEAYKGYVWLLTPKYEKCCGCEKKV